MSRNACLGAAIFSLAGAGCLAVDSGCPPLVVYTAQTQQQAARELNALPKGSALGRMIVDYSKTRDACRAAPGATIQAPFSPAGR